MKNKKVVKITAKGYLSKYGIVVDEDNDVAVVKVAGKKDHNTNINHKNSILIGKKWLVEVNSSNKGGNKSGKRQKKIKQ